MGVDHVAFRCSSLAFSFLIVGSGPRPADALHRRDRRLDGGGQLRRGPGRGRRLHSRGGRGQEEVDHCCSQGPRNASKASISRFIPMSLRTGITTRSSRWRKTEQDLLVFLADTKLPDKFPWTGHERASHVDWNAKAKIYPLTLRIGLGVIELKNPVGHGKYLCTPGTGLHAGLAGRKGTAQAPSGRARGHRCRGKGQGAARRIKWNGRCSSSRASSP